MSRRGYSAVRLTDHERRDNEKGYKFHIDWISTDKFPKGTKAHDEERERMHRAQRDKNEEWDQRKRFAAVATENVDNPIYKDVNSKLMPNTIIVNGVNGAQRDDGPVKLPELPKYDTSCTLKLDKDTGNTVLLVASSKAGKTTLQMHLYEKYFRKSIAIMFAHSTQLKIYKQKNLIVTDKFEPDIIEIMRKLNKASNNKFEFTCMFDDMLQLKNNVNVQDLFLSLRNSNISSLISLQYLNLLNKACRGNVNTVLGGAMNSDENILVFIKCYLQTFMRSKGLKHEGDQLRYYRELTKNHGFVNIHPSSGEITFCRLKITT